MPAHTLRIAAAVPGNKDDWISGTPGTPYDTGSTKLPLIVIVPKALGSGSEPVKVKGSVKISSVHIIATEVSGIDLYSGP